jgi:hypothetical protein
MPVATDRHLKLLADAGLALTAAEELLAEGAPSAARERAEEAQAGLAELRAAWPGMSQVERALIARAATSVRERLDALQARLPASRALSVVAAVEDPEQELDPEAA